MSNCSLLVAKVLKSTVTTKADVNRYIDNYSNGYKKWWDSVQVYEHTQVCSGVCICGKDTSD